MNGYDLYCGLELEQVKEDNSGMEEEIDELRNECQALAERVRELENRYCVPAPERWRLEKYNLI